MQTNTRICDRCKTLIEAKGFVARWRKGKLEVVCSEACLVKKKLEIVEGYPMLVPKHPQQSWELSI